MQHHGEIHDLIQMKEEVSDCSPTGELFLSPWGHHPQQRQPKTLPPLPSGTAQHGVKSSQENGGF